MLSVDRSTVPSMSTTSTKIEWHPAAEAFPMMIDGDLDALAADIKQNGLHRAITLLPDGTGLDGRNRLAACALAEVEPRFETYDGDDPAGFVISENVTRRHLKASQKAITAARFMPDRQNGKARNRGKGGELNASGSLKELAQRFDLGENVIKQARALLDNRADLVIRADGGEPIKPLYEQMLKERKDAEQQRTNLARMAERDADLATAVESGTMKLADALQQAADRERKDQDADRELQKLRDEAQTDSARIVRAFNAIAGQLIGTVTVSEWTVSSAEWATFCKAVAAVEIWRNDGTQAEGSSTRAMAGVVA